MTIDTRPSVIFEKNFKEPIDLSEEHYDKD